MSNQRTTTVPEAALAELAYGQSYFREHLQHATARIAELEAGQQIAEANIGALNKEAADLRLRLAQAGMLERQVSHDLAVHLRWQALQQCGVDVFSSGEHCLDDADTRLAALADKGEKKIRGDKSWHELETKTP